MIIYRRLAEFYKYIGHPEWNRKSIRGILSQSRIRYLYRLFRKQPICSIAAFFHLLTHWFEMEKKASYYIDVVEDIKQKMICKDIVENY